MNRTRVNLLMGTALLVFLGFPKTGDTGERISTSVVVEEKVLLEHVLESKAQRALNVLLGPRKAQITVIVDVNPSAIENIEMSPSKKPESSFTWRDPKSGESVLPGFHEETGNMPFPPTGGRVSRISTVSRFIQRINATIVADRSVPEEDAKNVREALYGVLALDVDRGDTLQLIRGNIPSETQEGVTWSLFTAYLALLFGIVGIVLLFFAMKAARTLGNSVKAAKDLIQMRSEAAAATEAPSMQTSESVLPPEDQTPESHPQGTEPTEGGPLLAESGGTSPKEIFGSFTESSALAVATYLANQPASLSAALLTVLQPHTAAAVLETFAPGFRFDVFKALGGNFNVSDEQKEALARPIAEFVRTFVHGPNVLVNIYESAPPSVQASIAAGLSKTDPRLWADVQATALTSEMLWALPIDQWVTLATELTAEDLAGALHEASPAERNRLTSALPKQLAALVDQHVKVNGTMAPEEIVHSRRKLFAAARTLSRLGKVSLTRVARA